MQNIDPGRLSRFAFALSLASTILYFCTSMGVLNFLRFLLAGAGRLLKLLG